MTKFRVGITIGIIAVAVLVHSLMDFFYSPITGAAAVNALNGGVVEYGMARFVQTGKASTLVQVLTGCSLAFVWLPFVISGKK